MSSYFTASALAVLVALCPNPSGAQNSRVPAAGVIAGQVMDSSGYALSNVEVTALKVGRSVRTDSVGAFILTGVPVGPNELLFRRLAFEPVVLAVQVPSADTIDVDVTLGLVAQKLTGVVVVAHPDQLRELVSFETHRRQGIGHFITRGQIEQRHPILLSDMMRLVPGARLVPGENGRTALRFSRGSRTTCPPQFYVDGMQVTGFSIDDMPPGDVEGVEVYAGAAGLPPEFNRLYSTSICGTVVIWTRIPGTRRAKP